MPCNRTVLDACDRCKVNFNLTKNPASILEPIFRISSEQEAMADSADTLLAQMGDILAHKREVKGVLAASPAFAVYLSGMINALHQNVVLP